MMKNYFIVTLIFCCIFSLNAQEMIPNNFRNPLDVPINLSGTFGEIRSTHFHAGLDIKTQGREGLNAIAIEDGYIARVKVSTTGYGKVVYIKHPSGYTSVYAHLQKFGNKIQEYVKNQQYRRKKYEVDLYLSQGTLPVKKEEIIGITGNTGSSLAPHLHFEIRDSKNAHPLNPLRFGFKVEDTVKPTINMLMGYPISGNAHINKVRDPIKISLRKLKNGDFIASKMEAFGKIGFGIGAFDRQNNNSYNKNGLYTLEMKVNGTPYYFFKASEFNFSEGKYVALLTDYKLYKTQKKTVHRSFKVPYNALKMIAKTKENGYLTVEEGLNYTVEIIAKDFHNNTRKITIPIVGKKTQLLETEKEVSSTPYKISHKLFSKFKENGVGVAFPKNTFFQDFYLDFKTTKNGVKVHDPVLPLQKKYTLTFDVSDYSEKEKQQLYIAYYEKDISKARYEGAKKEASSIYTSTKKLGNFILLKDSIPPSIKSLNFKKNQTINKHSKIQFEIKDLESGISSYKATLNGKWILMEYDYKKNRVFYNLNDISFPNQTSHLLELVVTDNVGNTKKYSTQFIRKSD